MSGVQVWTLGVPVPGLAEDFARRTEARGWDGLVLTDSQNMTGDPYVALGLAARATSRIGLGTGVTNPVTRHPAATAAAIATVQELSNGRAVLGIGRGDSALFHLGREPAPVGVLRRYLERLQGYLRGESVDLDGCESRMPWVARSEQPKVPVDVAATGPRVIAAAATLAERITFALGADPERLKWGIDAALRAREESGLSPDGIAFGAYVNVCPHPDADAARELARGGIATFAHFSGMAGSSADGVEARDREVFEGIHARYERSRHTLGRARHAAALGDDFLERFGVVGAPAHCVERLRELVDAGISRLVVTGASFDADREEASRSSRIFTEEVLPAVQGLESRERAG